MQQFPYRWMRFRVAAAPETKNPHETIALWDPLWHFLQDAFRDGLGAMFPCKSERLPRRRSGGGHSHGRP